MEKSHLYLLLTLFEDTQVISTATVLLYKFCCSLSLWAFLYNVHWHL